jgi:hypothetical protein
MTMPRNSEVNSGREQQQINFNNNVLADNFNEDKNLQ